MKKSQLRSPEFKMKVVIEALKREETLSEIASKYQLHPRQITRWKEKLLLRGKELFVHEATIRKSHKDPGKEELLHLINQLSLELEFLKKKLGNSQ